MMLLRLQMPQLKVWKAWTHPLKRGSGVLTVLSGDVVVHRFSFAPDSSSGNVG